MREPFVGILVGLYLIALLAGTILMLRFSLKEGDNEDDNSNT